jgi:plastin-1
MSSFFGVLVSDSGLQSQFTQLQLQTLKTKVRTHSRLQDSDVSHVFTSNPFAVI